MAGTQFKIDVAISDKSFPVLSIDPILPTQGAMLLVDLNHPAGPLKPGIPLHGELVPNIAWEQSTKLFGVDQKSTQADYALVSAPIVKRTTKGGLYTQGTYAGYKLPAALIDYMISKPSNDFYVSLWGYADAVNVNKVAELNRNGNDAVSALLSGIAFRLQRQGNSGPSETRIGTTPGTVGLGPYQVAAAWTSHDLAGGDGKGFRNGNGAQFFGTYGNNGSEARRSYRFYMEDLTVSGRTYAEVNALDAALYNKHVLTAGGRYYGDTVPA